MEGAAQVPADGRMETGDAVRTGQGEAKQAEEEEEEAERAAKESGLPKVAFDVQFKNKIKPTLRERKIGPVGMPALAL